MTSSIYRTAAGREVVATMYNTRLDALGLEVTSRRVSTRHGSTHLLLAGAEQAPPLIVLHGSNGDATQMAAAYGGLTRSHRCAFVDLPGEPNRSDEVRIPRGDGSLGQWMSDVLDGLGWVDAAMLGMSGGAYVILRCAATIPARVAKAVLLVPEGFVPMGPLPPPTPDHADSLVRAMTDPHSGLPSPAIDTMVHSMRTLFTHLREPLHLGPVMQPLELEAYRGPVLLFAGEHDAVFNGPGTIAAARKALVNLEDAVLVDGANHIHIALFTGPVLARIEAFLAES